MKGEREFNAKTQFNKIYSLYGKSIFNFCLSRLSGDVEGAEDCTQETFIVLYNRLKKGEQFEIPRAFLYKTALNLVKRFKSKKQKQIVNEAPLDQAYNAYDSFAAVENNIDYSEVVKRIEELLSEDEMKLFTMYFIENAKLKDVSLALNISPNACSTRLSRIRSKLKNGIKDYI